MRTLIRASKLVVAAVFVFYAWEAWNGYQFTPVMVAAAFLFFAAVTAVGVFDDPA